MASPRVFISSTCYDLKYIRENLKFFIRTIGYEPILSEDGDVFYNPRVHTHEACVTEVSTCQILVLIIGGRYGGKFKEGEKSITNMEYTEAVKLGIPIFALVENSVYSEHNVFNENRKKNKKIKPEDITYPSVDNIKIFDFIDEVRKNVVNNSLFPFGDFSDIESYLKKQWAGMMHYYITSETEAKRINQLFDSISEATQKIEVFTRQVASSIGDKHTKLTVKLYDLMLDYAVIRDLGVWHIHPSPKTVLMNENVDGICDNKIYVEHDEDEDEENSNSITYGGPPYKLGSARYNEASKNYIKLRNDMIKILNEENIKVEDYIENFG